MSEPRKIALFGPGMPVDVTDDWPPMPEELDPPWLEKARPALDDCPRGCGWKSLGERA